MRHLTNLTYVFIGWQIKLGLPVNVKLARMLMRLCKLIYISPLLIIQGGFFYIFLESLLALNEIFGTFIG